MKKTYNRLKKNQKEKQNMKENHQTTKLNKRIKSMGKQNLNNNKCISASNSL